MITGKGTGSHIWISIIQRGDDYGGGEMYMTCAEGEVLQGPELSPSPSLGSIGSGRDPGGILTTIPIIRSFSNNPLPLALGEKVYMENIGG